MLGVIGIGDNVCDKYINSGYMYPGGQALNVAVYAKRMGVRAAYMGVFGSDEVAAHVVATLDGLGIDHSHCRQYEGENGYAVVDIVDGERVFVRSNKGGIARERPIELTPGDIEYIRSFDLVHTSNNGYFDKQLQAVAATGLPISYDFSRSWRDLVLSARICPYLAFAFISCSDVLEDEALGACRRLRGEGCGTVVATMGNRGALFHDGRHTIKESPRPFKAVDTLGAGDSFAAGFLVSLMRDRKAAGEEGSDERSYLRSVRAALQSGTDMAAKTCMEHGAFGYGRCFEVERGVRRA